MHGHKTQEVVKGKKKKFQKKIPKKKATIKQTQSDGSNT